MRTGKFKLVVTFLWRWGPALAVMALIFVASSRAKSQVPDFGGLDWLVKKGGHLLVYGALALTYLRGLSNARAPNWRLACVAVVLAAAYGATDEFHQSFVAGRDATMFDVLIDLVGAVVGLSLYAAWTAGQIAWSGARRTIA